MSAEAADKALFDIKAAEQLDDKNKIRQADKKLTNIIDLKYSFI
jgi:hypothetical protein